MKKLFLVLLTALAVAVAPAVADQDTFAKPGAFSAQVGLGATYYGGFSVEGGANIGLAQVAFAPKFVLDFGAAGRVGFGSYGGLTAGAFGTASYSWKVLGLGIDWVDNLESYLGIGVDILPIFYFDTIGGNAYHFDKSLAVYLESGIYGSVLGARFSF